MVLKSKLTDTMKKKSVGKIVFFKIVFSVLPGKHWMDVLKLADKRGQRRVLKSTGLSPAYRNDDVEARKVQTIA